MYSNVSAKRGKTSPKTTNDLTVDLQQSAAIISYHIAHTKPSRALWAKTKENLITEEKT